jgi:preprotein translocase subunit SecA
MATNTVDVIAEYEEADSKYINASEKYNYISQQLSEIDGCHKEIQTILTELKNAEKEEDIYREERKKAIQAVIVKARKEIDPVFKKKFADLKEKWKKEGNVSK